MYCEQYQRMLIPVPSSQQNLCPFRKQIYGSVVFQQMPMGHHRLRTHPVPCPNCEGDLRAADQQIECRGPWKISWSTSLRRFSQDATR